jgi:hypothetical protein
MTYVDQCDTIRTLTEEEMAVVSGGAVLNIATPAPHGGPILTGADAGPINVVSGGADANLMGGGLGMGGMNPF